MSLPKWITDRKRAPHALRICLRKPALPSAKEIAAFCGGAEPSENDAEGWVRFESTGQVLVFRPEDEAPDVPGFPHGVMAESGTAKLSFLAAYFTARRCGGVVWVQKKVQAYASTAFADLYLGDEDLEGRWGKAVPD